MNNHSQLLFTDVRAQLHAMRGKLIPYSEVPHVPCRLDSQYVAFCALDSNIDKKLKPSVKSDICRDKAIALFISMNTRCMLHKLQKSALTECMKHFAYNDFQEPMDELDLARTYGLRSGPGASVGSHGQNSAFEKFFVNEFTTTRPSLYFKYLEYINDDASRETSELSRILLSKAFTRVNGSKITTVPKDRSIDRTICTEPSLNMAFQLALGDHINKILAHNYGYDSALQPDFNRESARIGSLMGSIATIDLSSASDTISIELIKHILPDWLYAAIRQFRSPTCSIDGKEITLHMVSTMGNGFTFPLQTYIFSLLLRSVAHLSRVAFPRFSSGGSFGVFGDDIICPTTLFDKVMSALRDLSFIPNDKKSFGHGYFRESCGTDWYNGVDVRAVYVKQIDTTEDRFSVLNRLFRWAARHRAPFSLNQYFPSKWRRYLVPSDLSDTAGMKIPDCELITRRRNVYTYTHRVPLRRVFRVLFRDMLVRTHDNPLGFILAAVQTCDSLDGCVSRRSDPVTYRDSRGSSPFWARVCDFPGYSRSDFLYWESLVLANIA